MLTLKEHSRWILITMFVVCLNIFIDPCLAGQTASDESGWIQNPANGHCYRLTGGVGWIQAEEQAVRWGGHLVTIHNREEELWLISQFGANECFWIGFNDISSEGNWVWISGEPVTYTNWSQWEPNNEGTYGEVEHGAIMNWSDGGAWNDNSIYNEYRGIVEVSQPVVSFWDKEEPSREVAGAAADGASEVIIKIICLPPSVTNPRQVTVTTPANGGELDDLNAMLSNGVFEQTWKAPKDFGGDGPNPERGRRQIVFQISIPVKNLDVPEFYLYKPPVLLLHGIWGKPLMRMRRYLLKNYVDDERLVYAPSYPNDIHFRTNIPEIGRRVDDCITRAREQSDGSIVVKKTDIVAHSMGGILAVLYANCVYSQKSINRIITFGTPHSGSELANFALHFLYGDGEMSEEERVSFLARNPAYLIFKRVKGSLTEGAVEDLQVGSDAIVEYRNVALHTVVPVYAIKCRHKDSVPSLWLDLLYRGNDVHEFGLLYWDWHLNKDVTYFDGAQFIEEPVYNPLKIEDGLFGSTRNYSGSDFVVSLESQSGGASICGEVLVVDHISEQDNKDVQQMVVTALKSRKADFDQDGFSPPTQPEYPRPIVGTYNMTNDQWTKARVQDLSTQEDKQNNGDDGTVKIISPPDGTVFSLGDTVVVQAVSTRQVSHGMNFISQDLSEGVDETEPYEFRFTIDPSYLGDMLVYAWFTTDDETIKYDSITINIVTDQIPEHIDTAPSSPLYMRSAETISLFVEGLYPDGEYRDITYLSNTHYTSSDPRILEIASKGVLKARFPGRAVVTIENSGVSTDIDILVKMVKGVHIGGIEIGTEWDYEDPDDSYDTEYKFSFEMITDESVENMAIFTPALGLFEIPRLPEEERDIPGGYIETGWEYDSDISAYRWYYEAIFDNPDGLDFYGDGDYTIIVQYNDANLEQKNVWFGIPDTNEPIPQPTKEPIFTSFINEDYLDSPVDFKWEPCFDPNVNVILVSLENEDTNEEMDYIFDGNSSGFEVPLPLSDGQWEADLSYVIYYQTRTADGIEVFCCKYSESDYTFDVW